MSNVSVDEVTWYQLTITRGMAKGLERLIGSTSVNFRVENYGIDKEDSLRLSELFRKLGSITDET